MAPVTLVGPLTCLTLVTPVSTVTLVTLVAPVTLFAKKTRKREFFYFYRVLDIVRF